MAESAPRGEKEERRLETRDRGERQERQGVDSVFRKYFDRNGRGGGGGGSNGT